MATPAQGLERLREAAVAGQLDALCQRHEVRVLTVFGSTARGAAQARDLDVGVLTHGRAPFDAVAMVNDLIELTGVDAVDLAQLDSAGPVLRERALVGCVPLYESAPGQYAAAQLAAVAERIETDANRRLDLEILSS